jgi:mono/diheme cytochrome c family protein
VGRGGWLRPAAGAGLLALAGGLLPAAQVWKAPPAERARANPVPSSEAALLKGRALYQRHCQSCHGRAGKGDGKGARFSSRPVGDLSRQDGTTEGEIFWKLSRGLREDGEIVMPRFADEIPNQEDRWKLVLYVRSLRAP